MVDIVGVSLNIGYKTGTCDIIPWYHEYYDNYGMIIMVWWYDTMVLYHGERFLMQRKDEIAEWFIQKR